MTRPPDTVTAATATEDHRRGLHQLSRDLRSAENELQTLRRQLRQVTDFIHHSTHDLTARRALAQQLGIPAPNPARTAQPVGGTTP